MSEMNATETQFFGDRVPFVNIKTERVEPGIVVIRVARPQALNALNSATMLELKHTLTDFSTDETVRVVVLTGEGEKAFIAGADIAEMKDMTPEQGIQFSQLGHDVARLLETMPQPTIAAVNGFALGGGNEMAMACDFILASDKAQFGQPEVALGMVPGFGGTFRLARHVGWPRAKELIFSGRRIKAEEAFRLGLCSQIFPAETFMSQVMEVAQAVARQSSSAVARAKKLMVEFSEMNGLEFKVDGEAHAFGRLFGSHDQREGMGAFLEKRKAAFSGLTPPSAN